MRTTVNIDDRLLRKAKQQAAASGRSLGEVVDDALRLLLEERARSAATAVRLPTFGGSGVQPGVDLEDKDALNALLDKDSTSLAAR